jgi:hypothetical protein
VNVVAFLISMAVFVFGLWAMSIAPETVGLELPIFLGGILCVALSLAIPFHVLGRADDV